MSNSPTTLNHLRSPNNADCNIQGVDAANWSEGSTALALPLDIYRISPTDLPQNGVQGLEGLVLPALSKPCKAPYFAIPHPMGDRAFAVMQGNCDSWGCLTHGKEVAKHHYGRIVEGCKALMQEGDLWFLTITCLGRDLSEAEAVKNYGVWTSKFLDALYTKARRAGRRWDYVQVTEKQTRGHPHSHIIPTYVGDDLYEGYRINWQMNNEGRRERVKVPALRSNWIERQLERSGLGSEYDISKVRDVAAASRYVAKYMFKETQFTTEFPPSWKRVRYSKNFPAREATPATDAFVLLTADDWQHLAEMAVVITTKDHMVTEVVKHHLQGSDVLISERLKEDIGYAKDS